MSAFPAMTLVAFSTDLYYAWREQFDGVAGVSVEEGNILALSADAIVSPANSFGYMDGGLDLKYSQHFGWELEARVRKVLEEDHGGEIPVGSAIIVATEHKQVPYLVSAPTMRVPMDVSTTINAYLAFKAVLLEVKRFNASGYGAINSILCPGLGTGEGRLAPAKCAKQMRRAWDVCVDGQYDTSGGLAQAVRGHMAMLGFGDDKKE
ncbi:MAG: macro domain-containing protein [Pseudomonadota bacterium]